MKWPLLLIFCLAAGPASAQFDTLLQRSFSDRYPVLLRLLGKYPKNEDFEAFASEIQQLSDFAAAYHDPKMVAELACVQFKKICLNGTRSRSFIDSAFEKAAQPARRLSYVQVLATLDLSLSEYLWEQKDYSHGIQVLESAFEKTAGLKNTDYYLKQEVIYQLGSRNYAINEYLASIYYLELALKHPNPNEPLALLVTIYNTLGLASQNLGRLKDAERYYLEALGYARQTGQEGWVGNLSGNLGHLYLIGGDLDRGESLLLTDKALSLKNGFRGPALGSILELSNIYFLKNEPRQAIAEIRQAMEYSGGKIPYGRKKMLFPVLSKMYGYQGDWRKAAMYLDSSLMVYDSIARLDNAVQNLRLKQQVELHASRVEIAEREAGIRKKNMQLYGLLAGLLFTLAAGLVVFRQKRRADKAKRRSDELLLNILPFDVAEELKQTGTSKARKFTECSVLFCDFKNFTQYAEQLDPEDLVRILNDYFKAFDQVVAAAGLEKIKTIGDAYMCAGGLPAPDPLHAEKTVQCALEFQRITQNSDRKWQLRIGIHSGPVVAGIVGIKKFAYDIWGDTVNTAARMEQNAEAGQVNVSQATYELVKHRYHCLYRGKVDAKNKGELDMYYVVNAV